MIDDAQEAEGFPAFIVQLVNFQWPQVDHVQGLERYALIAHGEEPRAARADYDVGVQMFLQARESAGRDFEVA